MTTTIRPATLADIDALVAMGSDAFERVRDIHGEFDPAHLARTAMRLIGNSSARIFVAEADGVPVGFLAAVLGPSIWAPSFTATELIMCVRPEHRRGGVATSLIQALAAWAEERGAALVVMSAEAAIDGEAVGALYERLGFVKQTTLYRAPTATADSLSGGHRASRRSGPAA